MNKHADGRRQDAALGELFLHKIAQTIHRTRAVKRFVLETEARNPAIDLARARFADSSSSLDRRAPSEIRSPRVGESREGRRERRIIGVSEHPIVYRPLSKKARMVSARQRTRAYPELMLHAILEDAPKKPFQAMVFSATTSQRQLSHLGRYRTDFTPAEIIAVAMRPPTDLVRFTNLDRSRRRWSQQ